MAERDNSTGRYKTVSVDQSVERKQSPIEYVLTTQKFRVRQDLASLRVAIESANNITNFNRFLLHNVYRELVTDPMVHSQWESRKMKTKEKKFSFVGKDGTENEEVTAFFNKNWFTDWIDKALDSKLWGFSLLEFGPFYNNTFNSYAVQSGTHDRIYDPITVIDRDYVKPEFGVITQNYGNNVGIGFSDPQYKDYIMFIGQTHDFGLLYKLARIVLYKQNALGNWSEWIEVFGMDKRVGYTRSQDADRRMFMKALRDLGSNSYGVFNETDKVEYIGTTRTDAYKVYQEFLKDANAEISKVIFGQDVISNNTGHVIGKTGENVSNMYGDTDARDVAEWVNDKLIPFVENLGFNCQGTKLQWDTSEKLSQTELADRDLKITQMGFKLDVDYVQNTYNVVAEEAEEPAPEAVKKTYQQSKTK